jgi:four helix bundle protein
VSGVGCRDGGEHVGYVKDYYIGIVKPKLQITIMSDSKCQSYRDLRVWQDAVYLAETCYRLTKSFPKEEIYGMTSQIRRASVSIAANIAEGYGRKNKGKYIHFLYIAQGSLKELETHLIISQRVEIISADNVDPVLGQCESIGRMLMGLIRAIESRK